MELDRNTLEHVLELAEKAWSLQEVVTMLRYRLTGSLPSYTDHTDYSKESRKILEENNVKHRSSCTKDEYGM